MILLDSMGGGKDKLVGKIRQYLTEEWRTKKGGEETFGKRDVRLGLSLIFRKQVSL